MLQAFSPPSLDLQGCSARLPDKESTKGAAPLATVFQVSGPAINKKRKAL